MITLSSILQINGIQLAENYKIHLATASGNDDPLEDYFAGMFDDYQGYQTKRNFECPQVVSLINLGDNRWLFVGVYEILGTAQEYQNGYWYELRLLPDQENLIARLVVYHDREGRRQSYIYGEGVEHRFHMHEYLPQRLSIGEYPGHSSVKISFDQLTAITLNNEPSWKSALSSIKGIYLILDRNSGLQYIGKADGNSGIWQRWLSYASNGHGGNVELFKLLKEKGDDYKRNFQYSILEIADFRIDDAIIGQRESHWKEVLGTRQYGLNKN